MQIDDALKEISVIGASGKMGKGIAALLLQEVARSEAEKYGCVGTNQYRVHLIDARDASFPVLKSYLEAQLLKYAEKNIRC